MGKIEIMKGKGWFQGLGRDGDRTLEQQMTGLDPLLREVRGKSVIDAGCAEGLISIELAKAGASGVVGFEIVPGFVDLARESAGNLPCQFFVANLNEYDLTDKPHADIVLMLAILHKLKDPSAVCAALAGLARDLCVIRMPPSGLVIVDARSGNVPHDIGAVMARCGFVLESDGKGPLAEWLGYFRRVPKTTAIAEPEPKPETVDAPNEVAPMQVADMKPETAEAENVKPPEQAAADEAERVAETGDPTPSGDPTEKDATAGVESGQPLFPKATRRSRKAAEE